MQVQQQADGVQVGLQIFDSLVLEGMQLGHQAGEAVARLGVVFHVEHHRRGRLSDGHGADVGRGSRRRRGSVACGGVGRTGGSGHGFPRFHRRSGGFSAGIGGRFGVGGHLGIGWISRRCVVSHAERDEGQAKDGRE